MELKVGATYRVLVDRNGEEGDWFGPWRYKGEAYSGHGEDRRREPSHLFEDKEVQTHRWWLLQSRQIMELELVAE